MCSIKESVLRNFTGKHLCWSLFLIKSVAFRPVTLLKRDSNTGVFLYIMRIFKNTYFEEYLRTTGSITDAKRLPLTAKKLR